VQKAGDYRESWQPYKISDEALKQAQMMADKVTKALTGAGIWGVEFFLTKQGEVIFSELSPRPHDTGMVIMISQDLSEFALHARAVLGLPIPEVRFFGASASKAIVVEGDATEVVFSGVEEALAMPGVQVRFFGKPEVHGHRRYGVVLATDENTEKAVEKAIEAFNKITADCCKIV
jgi:phosphoribosylglycinamide formyltransferase 2